MDSLSLALRLVFMSLFLDICCVCLCVFLHIPICLCMSVPLNVCLWESVGMGVGFSLGLWSPGLVLSFLPFICSRIFVCFCPCPVCLCWSVSPAVLSLKLLPLTYLFPSLCSVWRWLWSLPAYNVYTIFWFACPNWDWPPTLNFNSKFLGNRIWLAQFGSSVNFLFNLSMDRKAWSWGKEVSGNIKWLCVTDEQRTKVLGNGKAKEGKGLWKKDKMITIQKYYKHLTRNTSRIEQYREAWQNAGLKAIQ